MIEKVKVQKVYHYITLLSIKSRSCHLKKKLIN